MSIITRYTYSNPTINKIAVDRNNGFVWLAFNKGSDGFCHLKVVDANNLNQIYFDIGITADKILDLQIDQSDGYIYALLLNGGKLLAQYSLINPFTDNDVVSEYDYSYPFGTPTPLALTVDSNAGNVYILIQDHSGGYSPKILSFSNFGGFNELIDLNNLFFSNGTLVDVNCLTVDDNENIWISTYTNPAKLGRVWFASGGWNMEVFNLPSTSNSTSIVSYNAPAGPRLAIVSDTGTTNLTVIDITSTDSLIITYRALTGLAHSQSLTVDNNTDLYLYASGNTGKIAQILVSNPSNYSIINLSDASNVECVGSYDFDYLAYATTNESIGEAYLIDFRSNPTLSTNFQVIAQLQATLSTNFSINQGNTLSTNFVVSTLVPTTLSTNFSVLSVAYNSIAPIARTDFHVYINSVECPSYDLDLKSITITHTADEQSIASFTLARNHDKLDYDFQGVASQITNQNAVQIYIGTNLELDGKIAEINTFYEKDKEYVQVVVWADDKVVTPVNVQLLNTVLLPLPGLNEKRHLYHIILENPKIYNPYINPNDPSPQKYLGIRLKLGIQTTQNIYRLEYRGDTATLAAQLINQSSTQSTTVSNPIFTGTLFTSVTTPFIPLQNYTYFWLAAVQIIPQPSITDTTPATTVTNPQSAIGGSPFLESTGVADFENSIALAFQDFNHSIETVFSNQAHDVQQAILNGNFDTNSLILYYVGTSLSGLTSNLYNLLNASYYQQREFTPTYLKLGIGTITSLQLELAFPTFGTTIFNILQQFGYIDGAGNILQKFLTTQSVEDFSTVLAGGNPAGAHVIGPSYSGQLYSLLEDQLGYYVGSPPYKTVSARNGVLIASERWVDEDNGLYTQKDASYNFIGYDQIVAGLEYQKLLNINGQILPITKSDIGLTIDAYYFYGIKLLTRINIDNTTQSGIYNKANGFPIAAKVIEISSADMMVKIQADNQKSAGELLAIDGQYPSEDSALYNQPGYNNLLFTKFDLQSQAVVT